MTECFSNSRGKCYTRVPRAALYWGSLGTHAHGVRVLFIYLSNKRVLYFCPIFPALLSHFSLERFSSNLTILQNNTFTFPIVKQTLHLLF